ncbi:MAG: flagellar biosynthetic protein FliR [Oscillospiraceae bacterium]|nr:flagellar biosynthetic protein FliR [Oscillospiraceae bacterium]
MISNADYFLTWVVHYLLIVTRLSVLFVFSPLLARRDIPGLVKIGLSLLLAAIVVNFAPPPQDYPYNNLYALAFAVIAELSVGLVIGFITSLFFNLIYTAGHIIDLQIGFSMAQMYDVSVGGQVAVTSGFLNFILIVSFVTSGAFTTLIATMTRTFQFIPVGMGVLRPEAVGLITDVFVRTFAMAIQAAMPLLASALLLEVALGVIVRTAPQMNVFVVGIPLKVFLGLIVLALMLPIFTTFTRSIFGVMFDYIDRMTGGMIP